MSLALMYSFGKLCFSVEDYFTAVTQNSPAIALNSVDLPAPLEPITVTNSPLSSDNEIPSRALCSFGVPFKNVWRDFNFKHFHTLPFHFLSEIAFLMAGTDSVTATITADSSFSAFAENTFVSSAKATIIL